MTTIMLLNYNSLKKASHCNFFLLYFDLQVLPVRVKVTWEGLASVLCAGLSLVLSGISGKFQFFTT